MFASVCVTQRLLGEQVNCSSTGFPAGSLRSRRVVTSDDDELAALLDDLEQQASALYDAERAPDLADRSRSEYQGVTLAARLMATVGSEVTLDVLGVGPVRGVLARVATGWCVVETPRRQWVVVLDAVAAVEAASERAVPELAWPAVARLGLASALRRAGDLGERCLLHGRDGSQHDGVLRRVGHDFVEVVTGDAGRVVLVALPWLSAVQSERLPDR